MCGIAGVIGGGDEAHVLRMIRSIEHRGPDGVRIEQVGGATLAHARLSIIDLEGGWQPLHAAGSTVIGNGEIYNYLELIEEFELECATGSDFEPLLHLYAREGRRAFRRLRGMYAFCLIGCDGATWLVRDPFGIKPLYRADQRDDVLFASEPRSLHATGVWIDAAQELLTFNYTLGEARNGVHRLRAGDASEYSSSPAPESAGDGDCRAADSAAPPTPLSDQAAPHSLLSVLRPPPPPQAVPLPRFAGEEMTLQALDAVLEDSVRVHQRSDVPYGLFLSGGIDSSAIATLMARLNTRPVVAYTCGFDLPGAPDERASAERVAKALNLDWRETTFDEEDFWRILPEVAWALDDPTTDYATLPTWKLGEAARGTLTVVLSGEGGDELFAGYGRYRRALRPAFMGGRPSEPQLDAPFLEDGGRAALQRWREAAKTPVGLTRVQKAQWADIVTWLPNDLLLKLDRCLMAHGLEGRTPFLDREVAAFAFHLPDRLKVRGRHGKWILRKWLERHCPAADPWARKKGFTVPVAGWIAPRAADLARTIPAHEGVAAVCDTEKVRAVFTDPAQAHNRWPLLFYAVWWNIHVGGMERGEAGAALGAAP